MVRDALGWKRKASMVYAIGIWTVIGSCVYVKSKARTEDAEAAERKLQEQESGNVFIYEGAHSKTIVVQKKDFVPYNTRISNFFHSFMGGPGTGDSKK